MESDIIRIRRYFRDIHTYLRIISTAINKNNANALIEQLQDCYSSDSEYIIHTKDNIFHINNKMHDIGAYSDGNILHIIKKNRVCPDIIIPYNTVEYIEVLKKE